MAQAFSATSQARGIGQADVLDGHAHDAPPHVERIGTAVEHAHQPVQRGIGVRAAHRLVQGRDLVVEGVAALVEAAQVGGQRLFQKVGADDTAIRGSRSRAQLFQHVEQASCIAIGITDHALARLRHRIPGRRAPWPGRGRTVRPVRPASRLFSTYTEARDSSAEFTSKDGFSVVAPMKVTVPFST